MQILFNLAKLIIAESRILRRLWANTVEIACYLYNFAPSLRHSRRISAEV